MVKVSDLHKNQRTLTSTIDVEMGDGVIEREDITVTYKPGAYTPKRERELNEIQKDDWKSRFMLEWLHDMLVRWDVEDDEGVVETTVEGMAVLPMWFLAAVVGIIGDDMGKVQANSTAG